MAHTANLETLTFEKVTSKVREIPPLQWSSEVHQHSPGGVAQALIQVHPNPLLHNSSDDTTFEFVVLIDPFKLDTIKISMEIMDLKGGGQPKIFNGPEVEALYQEVQETIATERKEIANVVLESIEDLSTPQRP